MNGRRIVSYLFITLALTVVIGETGLASQEQAGPEVFAEVTRTFRQADELNAQLLSPQHYSKARKHFADAQNRLDKGQKRERIEKDIEKSLQELNLAIRAAELVQVALKDLLAVRSQARSCGLPLEQSKAFKEGEKKFQEAVKRVEKQDTKQAQKPSREAARHYRKAVLQSLQKDLLGGAEKQLRSSRKMIPRQAYERAESSLKDLGSELKARGKGEFPVSATVSWLRENLARSLSDAGVTSSG